MNKPHPRDYGFNSDAEIWRLEEEEEGRTAKAKKIESNSGQVTVAIIIALLYLWLFGHLSLLFGILIAILSFIVVEFVAIKLVSQPSEAYLRAAKYRERLEAYAKWLQKLKRNYWYSLSGPEFERETAKLFEAQGYEIETTPVSGDEGVDIYLRQGNSKIAVQCKAHKKPIGPAVIRELIAHAQSTRRIPQSW